MTQITPLTLESIAKWPLITYRQGITGRSRIDDAFARKGLLADIVLSAQDSDVIKTYVALGLGIGLVAEQSSGEQEEKNLIRWIRGIFSMLILSGWDSSEDNFSVTMSGAFWNFVMQDCQLRISSAVMENSEEEIDYQI